MGEVTNFKPARDEKAGLKDDITFTFTNMGEPTPVEFRARTDLQVQEAIANDDTLYLNVSPDGLVQLIVPGDTGNLLEATQQEKIDEFQRVAAIRKAVRESPSSFIALKYQVNDAYDQIITGQPSLLNTAPVKIERATKGDIIDIANEFKADYRDRPNAFTNFMIGNSQRFATVERIEDGYVVVDNPTPFVAGDFLSFVNCSAFLDASIDPNDPSQNNRDVILQKVESVNVVNSTIQLSEINPTFTPIEIENINENGNRMLLFPGIPVLANARSTDVGISLFETQQLIEGKIEEDGIVQGEIPFTRLYSPKVSLDDNNFIGNLDRSSVVVTLYENDEEIFLVNRGEAQPGVSVNYTLVRQNPTDINLKPGDVNVRIRMVAPVAKLSIIGLSQKGSNAIKLGARISTTPDQVAEDFNTGNGLIDTVAEKASRFAAVRDSAERGTPAGAGEFYFNFQLIQTQLVDRTSELTESRALDSDLTLTLSDLPIQIITATEDVTVRLPSDDIVGAIRRITNISTDGSIVSVGLVEGIDFAGTGGYVDLEAGVKGEANFIKLASGLWEETSQSPGVTEEVVNTVNLNKYGTVRIFDKIKITINDGANRQVDAVVKAVDTKQNLLILERPLQFNIPNGSTVEIPQSPLNPGRTYKLQVMAVDNTEA